MNIAIAASQKDIKAPIDPHFGRCKWFCLFNTETSEIVFIENEMCNKAENAGCDTAKLLIDNNVQMVIAGRFGSKVVDLFVKQNIQMVVPELPKTINEIINQIK